MKYVQTIIKKIMSNFNNFSLKIIFKQNDHVIKNDLRVKEAQTRKQKIQSQN